MKIYANSWFARFADAQGITGTALHDAVADVDAGQFDADLGGCVYKQRVARPGEGKSGGYRVIVCFRRGDRAFFVYGYPKSKRGNITAKERDSLKKLAKILLSMSDEQLQAEVRAGTFQEVLRQE
ncbi:type II toxin-antitoxin system RelE/ParE family toxin [Nitratidesulfovibrio sp.]|uniref:type II toxin-antitoxin system RelE/ParE family toxin n=1 Tax=Nitratidesulfovibrio sp. TaxID=2802297 RepID=UPI003342E0B3